jgi:hypothetical protein
MSEITAELLNKEQLIARAVAFLGLKKTPVLGKYQLKGGFLDILRVRGFKYEQREDGIITLAGTQPKEIGEVITNSWYWNFRTRDNEKDERALTLELRLFISKIHRGIVFWPRALGTFSSALDPLVNFKVFEAVAEYDQKAHPLIRKVVSEQGKITVYWTDIQLGGIRSTRALFEEFRGENKEIDRLSYSHLSPFNPNPYPQLITPDVFLPEPFQPALFQLWQHQLEIFQKSLTRV